jgi:hypothetical protein
MPTKKRSNQATNPETKGQKWLRENGPRFVIRNGQVWDKLKTRKIVVEGSTEPATAIEILNSDYEGRVNKKRWLQ